ncbi:MAG: hypothetical protein COV70_01255 [Parcubacteria group bacterium CG11_big_fil_rev_8_21_14_0_20_39_22]|nr:MAG: hypothetical protein COV70_01255 [Parcubacteria group bacterium CG11_big_fil_rev_8_21_14_0_20_39_22]
MKKAVISIIVIIIVATLMSIVFVDGSDPDKISEEVSHFKQLLEERGIKDVGQPIEGFDAELLMVAFPGFDISDFERVETLGGKYEVKEEELHFVQSEKDPKTSADKMVVDSGYKKILENITKRLDIEIKNVEDVEMLVSRIDTADTIRVGLGDDGEAFDIKVTPIEIIEDSRCPQNVECIQAGTVSLRVYVVAKGVTQEKILILGEAVKADYARLVLQDVIPLPMQNEDIDMSDYLFFFKVSI